MRATSFALMFLIGREEECVRKTSAKPELVEVEYLAQSPSLLLDFLLQHHDRVN